MRGQGLSVGDVAVEALPEKGPRTLPLLVPVVELQSLMACVVLEAELARRRVDEAREGRARAEEGRDPDVGEAAVGGAGGVRVERAAGDPAAQVAAELPVDARLDGRAVLALLLARAGAPARARHERAAVVAGQGERAVLVALDLERPLLG